MRRRSGFLLESPGGESSPSKLTFTCSSPSPPGKDKAAWLPTERRSKQEHGERKTSVPATSLRPHVQPARAPQVQRLRTPCNVRGPKWAPVTCNKLPGSVSMEKSRSLFRPRNYWPSSCALTHHTWPSWGTALNLLPVHPPWGRRQDGQLLEPPSGTH